FFSSNVRKTLETIILSELLWLAMSTCVTFSFCFDSQANAVKRTNCVWVKFKGSKTILCFRCQSKVTCPSKYPGLSLGALNLNSIFLAIIIFEAFLMILNRNRVYLFQKIQNGKGNPNFFCFE